ncbi:hypothetical protein SYJ56_07935 [Algoriphagus sp. D3-2-R+10]|uniref:hypothetical protein n=1 Tax=Algoriphagus aurantiacus TaxID=3103948 RepID=UPI002B3DF2FB|nr:hypothetical protein [Algoriphagus sp. D3-2-R+10]MEB2775234.1 hypothetical protein [Algoriphagus sp. D3-2-R+10]
MFGYCVGVIKIRPNDFWNLEDTELISIIEEYEHNDLQFTKLTLEENRLINYHIVAVHNEKIKRPKQLYKLPWEGESGFTLEEIQKNIKILGIPYLN